MKNKKRLFLLPAIGLSIVLSGCAPLVTTGPDVMVGGGIYPPPALYPPLGNPNIYRPGGPNGPGFIHGYFPGGPHYRPGNGGFPGNNPGNPGNPGNNPGNKPGFNPGNNGSGGNNRVPGTGVLPGNNGGGNNRVPGNGILPGNGGGKPLPPIR